MILLQAAENAPFNPNYFWVFALLAGAILVYFNARKAYNFHHSDNPLECEGGVHPDSKVDVKDYELKDGDPDKTILYGVCQRCLKNVKKDEDKPWVDYEPLETNS